MSSECGSESEDGGQAVGRLEPSKLVTLGGDKGTCEDTGWEESQCVRELEQGRCVFSNASVSLPPFFFFFF